MKKLETLLTLGVLGLLMSLFSSSANAIPLCPGTSYSSYDCNLVITFNADGSITTSGPGGTYDGVEDALIGVVNNTGGTLSSFDISGNYIFGFDGDGINTFNTGVTNAAAGMSDASLYAALGIYAGVDDYGGEHAYFTGVDTTNFNSGTVNFLGGIASGGTDYFSLEEAITLTALPIISHPVTNNVPEPSSLALISIGLFALGWSKRKKA